eukprot:gene10267-12594_t
MTPTIRFLNREQAGSKLCSLLEKYKDDKDAIIVALPRGGVPVAFEISKKLNLPLDIVAPRKIGCPDNKEYAIGAIAENGQGYIDEDIVKMLGIDRGYINSEIERQRKESKRRLEVYRGKRPPVNFTNKTIILVDDGIATGSTMKAAIESVKCKYPKRIIVAVPVTPPDVIQEILSLGIDKFECIQAIPEFGAVGNYYVDFQQTEDETVIRLMNESLIIQSPQL